MELETENLFITIYEVRDHQIARAVIRLKEKEIENYTKEQFDNNFEGIKEKVAQIVESIRSKK